MNLLNDVIREGDYGEFRERLAKQVRRAARLNRWRHTRKWMAVAAAIAFIPFLIPTEKPLPTPAPLAKVETVPYLKTIPLKPEQILTTRSAAHITIQTDHTRKFPSISDNELLSIFPRRRTALIASSAHEKRLLFLNPKDATRFVVSN